MIGSEEVIKNLKLGRDWTLFLDRDGVINKKIENDYVKSPYEFEFCKNSTSALQRLTQIFGITVIVTNQQGIGKGLMSHKDLEKVHEFMLTELSKAGASIDKVYYCPDLAKHHSSNRKPNTGMGLEAQKDFPSIDFKKSFMVGDALSDIQFGKQLGMQTVYIFENPKKIKQEVLSLADFSFESLWTFSNFLSNFY